MKDLKIEDELETVNSDKSGDKSETVDPKTPNQLKAKRKKGQQKRRQHRDNKGVGKGCTSRQADQKGRAARARCEARRNQSEEPKEQKQAQHWPDRLDKPRTQSVAQTGA